MDIFCKSLTARLKGSGMRWDKDNAQAIMSLAALYAVKQWKQYWGQEPHKHHQKKLSHTLYPKE